VSDPSLSTSEAARLLRRTDRQVRRLVQEGKLPARRVDNMLRIRRSDVDAYLRSKLDAEDSPSAPSVAAAVPPPAEPPAPSVLTDPPSEPERPPAPAPPSEESPHLAAIVRDLTTQLVDAERRAAMWEERARGRGYQDALPAPAGAVSVPVPPSEPAPRPWWRRW
jgi:excisionase family DNA binding protein